MVQTRTFQAGGANEVTGEIVARPPNGNVGGVLVRWWRRGDTGDNVGGALVERMEAVDVMLVWRAGRWWRGPGVGGEGGGVGRDAGVEGGASAGGEVGGGRAGEVGGGDVGGGLSGASPGMPVKVLGGFVAFSLARLSCAGCEALENMTL